VPARSAAFVFAVYSTTSLAPKLCTTYLSNCMELALIEKPLVAQLLRNFKTFYGTRRFIAVFTGFRHWSLSWARWFQSISPHPISLKVHFNIILQCTFLSLTSGLFLAFPPKSYMHSSYSHSCYMPCPFHPSWLGHFNYTWRRVQVMNLLIMYFSPSFYYFVHLRYR
jgi:hypothetical protein